MQMSLEQILSIIVNTHMPLKEQKFIKKFQVENFRELILLLLNLATILSPLFSTLAILTLFFLNFGLKIYYFLLFLIIPLLLWIMLLFIIIPGYLLQLLKVIKKLFFYLPILLSLIRLKNFGPFLKNFCVLIFPLFLLLILLCVPFFNRFDYKK